MPSSLFARLASCLAALILLSAPQWAAAQEQQPPPSPPPEQQKPAEPTKEDPYKIVEEVTVTGTLIPR